MNTNDMSTSTLQTKATLALRQIAALPNFAPLVSSCPHPLALLYKPDSHGYTPLHYAATSGNIELVGLLTSVFATMGWWHLIESRDAQGKTALTWCITQGRDAIVKLMIDNSANVNGTDFDGLSPLHTAIIAFDEAEDEDKYVFREIISCLLQNGANPNACDLVGSITPLHQAAEIGDVALVKMLIKHGAWVGFQDNQGENPLFLRVTWTTW